MFWVLFLTLVGAKVVEAGGGWFSWFDDLLIGLWCTIALDWPKSTKLLFSLDVKLDGWRTGMGIMEQDGRAWELFCCASMVPVRWMHGQHSHCSRLRWIAWTNWSSSQWLNARLKLGDARVWCDYHASIRGVRWAPWQLDKLLPVCLLLLLQLRFAWPASGIVMARGQPESGCSENKSSFVFQDGWLR